ncbi:MAG: cache domain-containing protein, partial [Myxococcota bacterium]
MTVTAKDSGTPKRRGLGLAGRLSLAFVVLASLPLCVITWVTYRMSEREVQSQVVNGLVAVAEAKLQRIERYVTQRKRDVELLAQVPSLIETLGEKREPEASVTSFLTYYRDTSGFAEVLLISPDSRILHSTNSESSTGSSLKAAPYVGSGLARVADNAMTLLQADVSAFAYYEPSARPAAFIAAPVFSSGRLVGVVATELSNREIYNLAADYTGLGQTGETVLVSKKENEAVVMAPLRSDPGAAFQRRIDIDKNDTAPIALALGGNPGAGVGVDYRGYSVLAAWRYLPSFRWGLVVKIDTNEAFASVVRLRNYALG